MKVTILIAGAVPKVLKGTVIACDGMAEKKKADWWVFVEDQGDLKPIGKPKVCTSCSGHATAIKLRSTHNSWDSSVNLALALARYLRADSVKVYGLSELDEEAQAAFKNEARLLWRGESVLI